MNYDDAGVSLAAADASVARIAQIARRTFSPRVLTPIGGFGAAFDISGLGGQRPTLVSTTDGVGTKTEVARAGARYEGLGRDLVAMCVDDLVTTGAQPLFFLDYLAMGAVDPALVSLIVESIATALLEVNASLVGGELAEHPGVLEPGQVDLAGFAVGILDPDQSLGAHRVENGDVVLGLPSPNVRANGFSLIRAIYAELLEQVRSGRRGPSLADGRFLYDALVEPSVLYTPTVRALTEAGLLHAAAHVTGGGLAANLQRVLPPDYGVAIRPWPWPEIFTHIAHDGDVPLTTMRTTFNLGVGMVLVAPPAAKPAIQAAVPTAIDLGVIERSREGVEWIDA